MTNVCFLISHFDGAGGAERVGNLLANKFCERYHVSIVAVYGVEAKDSVLPIDPSITTTTLLPEEGRLRDMAKAMRKPLASFLKEQSIDVLILIGNYQGFLALPALLASGVKSVFCDHGALMNQWNCKDVRLMRRLCSRFCSATVTLTEQSRKDYIKHFHLPTRKVTAIYNPIPAAHFDKRLPYNATSKKVLWLGRITHEKGWDNLIKVAAKALPNHPDWQWDVYGSGDDYEALKEGIYQAGIQEQMILKGFTLDTLPLYNDYAFLTLTSYREGLPLVLLEGKSQGLPMVSFDVSTGPSEVIRDGIDGFLIECYDIEAFSSKVEQLMQDDALRCSMAAASQDNLDIFSEESIFSKWKTLIDSLCQ